MNTRGYALFFTALLASTFIHEIRAKHINLPLPRHVGAESELLLRADASPDASRLVKRSVDSNELECGVANQGNSYQQFVLWNPSQNVGCAFEPESNKCAVFNGNNGAAFLIDLTANKFIQLTAGAWLASSRTLSAYLGAIVSINALYALNVSVEISISSATTSQQVSLGDLCTYLSNDIGIAVSVDVNVAFTKLVTLANNLIGCLNGSLLGVLAFVSITLSTVLGDLDFILNVLLGIGRICDGYTGGLSALITLGVVLDINACLSASNGIEVLILILAAIQLQVDVSVLSAILNDVVVLLDIIAQLGGYVFLELNGLLYVLSCLVSSIANQIDVEIFFRVLIMFCGTLQNENTGSLTITASVTALLAILNASASVSLLVDITVFLQAILDGNCTYLSIDISAALTLLLTGIVSDVLTLVLSVALLLTSLLGQTLCISYVLLCLYQLLDTTVGALCLNLCLSLGLNVSTILSATTNLLAALVGSVVSILLSLLLLVGSLLGLATANLSIIIPKITLLNTVYALLDTCVRSNTSTTVDNCVDSSSGNPANPKIRTICNNILGI